ncbi:hypothetical protein EG328_009532 [Venturia inaequalis]|uniref:Uncharacterized protein n=1 Tax=Venturia inaequalis TaxID=5025 RepID=A0A8H3V5V2_VENIN|nr:hypothetical protein EG328_009532 [Venturia inaequalis]RDI87647.1 hypothetical protein Vi05172_g2374 [Venturia inaequalis]
MPARPVSQINIANRSKARANGTPVSKTAEVAQSTPPIPHAANGASPYQIMAARIANRVAEMAENVTFAERPVPQPQTNGVVAEPASVNGKKKTPRKLEIRLPDSGVDGVKFSAPFLDNTLSKMLALQNRMLKTGSEIAASDAGDDVKREQFEQSAELSRIIALICAEKARQGVA